MNTQINTYLTEKKRIAEAVKPSMTPAKIRKEFRYLIFKILSDNKRLSADDKRALALLEYPLDDFRPKQQSPPK